MKILNIYKKHSPLNESDSNFAKVSEQLSVLARND